MNNLLDIIDNNDDADYAIAQLKIMLREKRQNSLLSFTYATMSTFQPAIFHKQYYNILTQFAKKEFKKLMVFMPPQHGKSEGSTRRLPSFLLGRNPDTKVAIVCYSASKARKFNREIQRIIDTDEYREVFPGIGLNSRNIATVSGSWLRNADECEIVGHKGGFKTVGVGGALTGESVDVLIMDDIYKDAKTAWSATVREGINDWYDSVAETRLHNDSQQLIVFTRWHEEDLAGKLLAEQGEYNEITNPNGWVVVIYPAIKIGEPTKSDPRRDGEPLWAEKHSLASLIAIRNRNPVVFDSLYQQDPKPAEGLMYSIFKEYDNLPMENGIIKNYTDTADTGDDYLCSITYFETLHGNYVLDIVYTQKPMEFTEIEVAKALTRFDVVVANIESNNGGRSFARNVEKNMREMGNTKTIVRWFHQSNNKNTRIFTHSADVQNMIYYPKGWENAFPEYAKSMKHYKKIGKNPHDDAQDAATGTIEKRDINKKKINLADVYRKVY